MVELYEVELHGVPTDRIGPLRSMGTLTFFYMQLADLEEWKERRKSYIQDMDALTSVFAIGPD